MTVRRPVPACRDATCPKRDLGTAGACVPADIIPTMLSRLIYASRAVARMNYPQIREINEVAVRLNTARGVTGLLIYGTSSFLQILEGDRVAISQTFNRIARDTRHDNPMLIDFSEIAERGFQQWAMRLVMLDGSEGPKTTASLLKFGVSDRFNPTQLSRASAVLLLQELAQDPIAA